MPQAALGTQKRAGTQVSQSARSRALRLCVHAVASPALAGPAARPAGPPTAAPTKCLKEWAPTIEALGHGEQTILLRKGGIREPTFRPEAATFLLFPTAFHTQAPLLRPGVAERYAEAMALDPKAMAELRLPYVAQVTGAWATHDAAVLEATSAHHVWTPEFLEARLKWRSKQPLTLLELRVWRLAAPVVLPLAPDMFGCFSWVDVSAAAPPADLAAGLAPVLPEGEWAARQAALRAALAGLALEALELPAA